MNDRVEEIYTQMFAPHPIPQSVIDLYDRTVFLANRIDQPNIPTSGLVMIAAIATKGVKSSVSKPVIPEEVDMTETTPAHPELDVGVTNDPVQALQTPPEPTSTTDPMTGPLGPMDAPQGETTESGAKSLEASLKRMSKDELIAHATGVCGMTKKQAVGRTKQGRCTKSDIQQTTRAKIIERILGQKNG